MTPDPWCPAAAHGDTPQWYWRGCRCTAARRAETVYRGRNGQWATLLSSVGVSRRLQALAALGWSAPDLGARLGVREQQVQKWRAKTATVYPATAERIRALYDELSMRVGPSDVTRRRAEQFGWAPPLAWDDDLIDDPAAEPQGIRRPDRRADFDDVELLARCGETWEVAARRLGISREALERRVTRAGRDDLLRAFTANSAHWYPRDYRNQWSA